MKKRQKSEIFERAHKRIAFKTCSECGTSIENFYGLCYNCWQIRKTNSRSNGEIPEPIETKNFMDKMGIIGWNS